MNLILLMAAAVFGSTTLVLAQEVIPSSTPIAQRSPISDQEKAKVLQSLKERILREDREQDTREKNAKKDLIKTQNDRRREWRDRERKARRAYFEFHGSGPERRAYVQDFVKRKKDFDYHEKVEWTEFKHQQKEARESLSREHRALTDRVNQSLSNKQMPEGF